MESTPAPQKVHLILLDFDKTIHKDHLYTRAQKFGASKGIRDPDQKLLRLMEEQDISGGLGQGKEHPTGGVISNPNELIDTILRAETQTRALSEKACYGVVSFTDLISDGLQGKEQPQVLETIVRKELVDIINQRYPEDKFPTENSVLLEAVNDNFVAVGGFPNKKFAGKEQQYHENLGTKPEAKTRDWIGANERGRSNATGSSAGKNFHIMDAISQLKDSGAITHEDQVVGVTLVDDTTENVESALGMKDLNTIRDDDTFNRTLEEDKRLYAKYSGLDPEVIEKIPQKGFAFNIRNGNDRGELWEKAGDAAKEHIVTCSDAPNAEKLCQSVDEVFKERVQPAAIRTDVMTDGPAVMAAMRKFTDTGQDAPDTPTPEVPDRQTKPKVQATSRQRPTESQSADDQKQKPAQEVQSIWAKIAQFFESLLETIGLRSSRDSKSKTTAEEKTNKHEKNQEADTARGQSSAKEKQHQADPKQPKSFAVTQQDLSKTNQLGDKKWHSAEQLNQTPKTTGILKQDTKAKSMDDLTHAGGVPSNHEANTARGQSSAQGKQHQADPKHPKGFEVTQQDLSDRKKQLGGKKWHSAEQLSQTPKTTGILKQDTKAKSMNDLTHAGGTTGNSLGSQGKGAKFSSSLASVFDSTAGEEFCAPLPDRSPPGQTKTVRFDPNTKFNDSMRENPHHDARSHKQDAGISLDDSKYNLSIDPSTKQSVHSSLEELKAELKDSGITVEEHGNSKESNSRDFGDFAPPSLDTQAFDANGADKSSTSGITRGGVPRA